MTIKGKLETLTILECLVELGASKNILTNFIKNLIKKSRKDKRTGYWFMAGETVQGGTVSGRESSKNPNMQNLPSGSEYGKLFKGLIDAPEGYLLVSVDFNALEDYIKTLQTRDPAMMDIYLKGYDGHCFRAYKYYNHLMPDIENTVESINSIQSEYPKLRQASKAPSFALNYQGTFYTLMSNLGLSKKDAKDLERLYKETYAASIAWTLTQLKKAAKKGYMELAFGLRLKTSFLHHFKFDKEIDDLPYSAQKETRTLGNAITQSYGLLNTRAVGAFMKKVWASKYKYDILHIIRIHDSAYFYIKNDPKIVKYFNDNYVKEMQWQELPELEHETIRLGGTMGVHYPTMAQEHAIPNNASLKQIRKLLKGILSDNQ